MTWYSTRLNTFVLNCFIQFTCTNFNGCQEEGDDFLSLLQKDGVPKNGVGVPQRGGGGITTLEETGMLLEKGKFSISK